MNNQPDRNPNQRHTPPPQAIDKTYIEGESQQPIFPELRPGTRVNATSFHQVNPYTQTGRAPTGAGQNSIPVGADSLPTGNDPIPLGSGTIVGLLGSGGMAKVYKIWNEKLEVFRAVKILLPTQQVDLKSRFETEAKITAKLHHPNIVEIYNVGEWNNLPYLEMEYIDGSTLEALISKNGKLPDPVCSAIAILVARALEYAHSQEFLIYGKTYHGVIHRDLKPANIMIPNFGDVRLMDFGIARPTEASLHTVEGNIVGTMQYLSPEQMDGVDIDARTDIYSFGAILYEILTGTKTFPQDTITNLMKKKIMNEYRRFSDFDFPVSHQLARISQKCLQINKSDRYPDMSALLNDLETAHRALIAEIPGKVLKRYLSDPGAFEETAHKGMKIRISPKIVIPIGGIIGIGALVSVFLITGPKGEADESETKPVAAAINSKPLPATPAPVPSTPATPNGLQPLAPDAVEPSSMPQQPAKAPVRPDKPYALQQRPVTAKQKNVTVSPPPPQPDIQTKPQPPLSPIDELKQKYESEDLMTIGKKAISSQDYSGAVLALTNVPDGNPEGTLKKLLLLDAYINTGKTGEALVIATSERINDAQFDYLCGKLYERTGKDRLALELYQTALTKPSIVRSRNDIRNDALFQTAILWSAQHRVNPTPDSRIQLLNAWNTVKRTYMATPENPRFKRANAELASIQ